MKIILCTILLFSICWADSSEEWPQWRGKNSDGIVTNTNMFAKTENQDLATLWKQSLGSGYSSISIAQNFAITMFSDGEFDYVIAFNSQNGEKKWQYQMGKSYKGHDGSHDGPISTPTIYKNQVFVLNPQGNLFALELSSGNVLWHKDLEQENKAKAPFYGFGTSPLVCNDMLIVQAGQNGSTVSALNLENGDVVWSTGTDSVNYQTPLFFKDTLICTGDNYLYGVNANSGEIAWEYHHKGRGSSTIPIVIDAEENKLFFQHKSNEGILLQVNQKEETTELNEIWTTKRIGQTYCPPVYYDNHLYGYSGRFLTCIDANSGKKIWKSREPGDGFCILVDKYLVIITKEGGLHIAKASSEKYEEVWHQHIFDDLVWTPPSFANGKIYLRSLAEIACIELREKLVENVVEKTEKTEVVSSEFLTFVKEYESVENKEEHTKKLFAKYTSFPIAEENFIHFVYNGKAQDMAMEGDLVGFRTDKAMIHIKDTNVFYYSSPLEKNARIQYRFVKDLEEKVVDPLNPNKGMTMIGEMSVLAMPEWQRAKHLEKPVEVKGKQETVEVVTGDITRKLEVYLPQNYQTENSKNFPVLYVHGGKESLEYGQWIHSLENTIENKAISPVIAVFIPEEKGEYFQEKSRIVYMSAFADKIVPFIDSKYRTLKSRDARVNYGAGSAGVAALFSTLKYPQMFSGAACQSAFLLTTENDQLQKIVPELKDVKLYVEWGKYDLRSPLEGWSILDSNRSFAKLLEKHNIAYSGGEIPIGFDWANWRNQNQEILATFFGLKTEK